MRQRRRTPTRAGFTLMELLLVMAILVILLGLVAPRFLGTQKKANESAARSQIGLLKGPLENYALDMNNYPSTEEGLVALVEAPSDSERPERWAGPYLDETSIPTDPWGNEFQYEYPPSHNEVDQPDIWSIGPDGEDGTDDDITNWSEEDEDDA